MKIIPITSASHSRLVTFESCKLRAQLQYGQKIPEPERPLPEGKTEHANDRGTRIHTDCENYVLGSGEVTKEMERFRPEFEALRRLYLNGKVSLEGEWGFNQEWEAVEWKKAWLRMKLDAIVFLSKHEAVVIDYKSGKKFGNEVKHAEQTQLYQLASFLRYPELEVIHTELWYLDQKDELTQNTFTRSQGLRFRSRFDKRLSALTTATEFPANPNIFTCRYCGYGPRGTGDCPRGV
jgi:hypothetical protein